MGQRRITGQKTCELFVLNVMRAMIQIMAEIFSLQSKKYFQKPRSAHITLHHKFKHHVGCNMTNLM